MIKFLKNLFKIARLLSVDDSDRLRFAVVSALGKDQKVLMFSPYGLMHNPPVNSLVTIWSQQAQESNGIGIADDPANRILKGLSEGEVAVGNYITGDYVYFKDGNIVEIVAGTELSITAPTVNVDCDDFNLTASNDVNMVTANEFNIEGADIELTGDIDFTGTDLKHNGTNVGDTHVHSQGNDSDGDSEVDTDGPK